VFVAETAGNGGNGERIYFKVPTFFRGSLNYGAYVASKELNVN
jgi:hypothetical protein